MIEEKKEDFSALILQVIYPALSLVLETLPESSFHGFMANCLQISTLLSTNIHLNLTPRPYVTLFYSDFQAKLPNLHLIMWSIWLTKGLKFY